ncbi:type 1 glutamine amidotransferase [Aliiroseovarius halocynthiae]|uniref:Type 1 glutamine amidotransferase n=1 Tax=Aliiroseovarius halocynthiae TaxID=985055 RepID=A0A545SSL9_9RHOB|nr:type 1 glutamine amidotransferase [Aliiroseovarius halocynthiae]TQV67935.1 type 1 glutamine amidotransferase [Aliiroseovarius halocynthiae]
MHIAILMANTDESEFAQLHPKDGEKWTELLAKKRPDWTYAVFAVKDGDFPRDLTSFDGFVITGSPASVHDGAPWMSDLFALIRKLNDLQLPMFGACFGHQAIAKALGGKVETNPDGWVFGSTEMEITEAAPWLEVKRFWLYGAHIEQVTKMPNGALNIMSSEGCPMGGFRIGDHVFTTQNHPEMTRRFIVDLIEELADDKPAEVIANARESLRLLADGPIFASWIVRFFEHAKAAQG